MGKVRVVPLPWTTVYGFGTQAQSIVAGPWLAAGAIQRVRVTWEFRTSSDATELQVAPGYQTADQEDDPGSDTTLGSQTSSEGMKYPTAWTDVSSNTEGKQLFRPVWRVSNAAANTLTAGRVGGVMEIEEV